MWKIISNIFTESIQVFSVLLGAQDVSREFQKSISSAERFVNWGRESNSPIDFQEAMRILNALNSANMTVSDKILVFRLKGLALVGIMSGKEEEIERFYKRMQKKYDSDEYMETIISGIAGKMKILQEIIAAAEANDTIKLRQLVGPKKVQETRPEEIALDAKKEYETVEDNYIMKKSVLENKRSEINNYKTLFMTEITKRKEEIDRLIVEIDSLTAELSDEQIKTRNQYKEEIINYLQATHEKLKKVDISLTSNKKV